MSAGRKDTSEDLRDGRELAAPGVRGDSAVGIALDADAGRHEYLDAQQRRQRRARLGGAQHAYRDRCAVTIEQAASSGSITMRRHAAMTRE